MSCMMLTEKQIATLAATLATMYNIGLAQGGSSYENFGIDMDGMKWTYVLKDEGCLNHDNTCDGQKLARLLYRANMAAYNGRYDEHQAEDIPEEAWAEYFKPYCYNRGLTHYAPWGNNQRHELAQWHFDFSILLDHYLYQLEEDATRDSELFKVMSGLSATVKSCIVYMDPRRRDAYSLLRELA